MQEIIKTGDNNNSLFQPVKYATIRQIGKTTFLVSSRFKGGKEGDIVSTFARLLQYDTDKPNKV